MDSQSFDRIVRLLGGETSRRGLAAVIAALAGETAIVEAASRQDAKSTRSAKSANLAKAGPAGPCGPNGGDNACKTNKECCTGYCKTGVNGKRGRCRCLRVGQACKPTQTCCPGLACRGGSCACTPNGAACSGDTCCNGDTCSNGTCQQPTKQIGELCDARIDICAGRSICRRLRPDAQSVTLPGTYCSLDTGRACTPSGTPSPTTDCVGGWCSPTSMTKGACARIDQVKTCTTSTDTCAGTTGFGMVEAGAPPTPWLCTVTVDNRPCRLTLGASHLAGSTCASDNDCTTTGHPACVDFPVSASQCSYLGFTGLGSYCRDAQIACAIAGDCPAKPSLAARCSNGYCTWA